MKILMLSWRDIKHPKGGGAEKLSHEMARRWVAWGNEVVHFSASFPESKKEEHIDKVFYIRGGNPFTVHFLAFIKIISGQFGKFDVIVDEVHGYSFFASLYSPVPVVCLACEVAKDIWDEMISFPFNVIGKLIENVYLFFYRNVTFLTISESSKSLLVAEGVNQNKITVLPMGFTYPEEVKVLPKYKKPTIIFLGRLAKTKGVPDAIKALAIVIKQIPDASLIIVGKGTTDYEQELKGLIRSLNIEKAVEFKGFVSEQEKFILLSKSHLIVVPSIREGWGLIVPEANIVETPAVVYNVEGLRDVTKNGINGLITNKNTPEDLAEKIVTLLKDKNLYAKMKVSSRTYARSLNWDDTAKVGLDIIKETVAKR